MYYDLSFTKDFPYSLRFWYENTHNQIQNYTFLFKTFQSAIEIINTKVFELFNTNLTETEIKDIENINLKINEKPYLDYFYLLKRPIDNIGMFSDFNIQIRKNNIQFENKIWHPNHRFGITLNIIFFSFINENIISETIISKYYSKTNDPSQIVIYNDIESFVGFHLKNDPFSNRNFLNSKIIKMSLDNTHLYAGLCLTSDDFQPEITSKYLKVNCFISVFPFITPIIIGDFPNNERETIENEKILSERHEEKTFYPWKSLENISYPEFDFNNDFTNYYHQLYHENLLKQSKRNLFNQWQSWNSTIFANKLPSELTFFIREILIGKEI